MFEKLNQYNGRFVQNDFCGDVTEDKIFEFCDCSSKLILSAPHATQTFCNKKIKIPDLYTGAIVKYLGETNNVSTLVRTKFVPKKELISDYIEEQKLQNHYFLDVHGFNQEIGYDICLGTGYWEEKDYPYLKEIYEIIKRYNLKPVINHPKYMGKFGLTGRFQKRYSKPNVIQMELKYYLRDFNKYPDTFKAKTLPMFNEIINLYK